MKEYPWTNLLDELSAFQLADHDFSYIENREQIHREAIERNSLSLRPASVDQVAQAQTRLGTNLPPSYRSFLLTSNGWGPIDQFIWHLLPVQEITWCKDSKPGLVEGWLAAERESEHPFEPFPDEYYLVYGEEQSPQDIRPEYLETALQISEMGDAAMVLLNPVIQDDDGEWEAWYFSAKMPGAIRYRSFHELMQAQLQTAREYRLELETENALQSMPRPANNGGSDEPSS